MDDPLYWKMVVELLDALEEYRKERGDLREKKDRHISIAITDTEKLLSYIEHYLLYGE